MPPSPRLGTQNLRTSRGLRAEIQVFSPIRGRPRNCLVQCMTQDELRQRTQGFAVIVKCGRTLRADSATVSTARPVARSGTPAGATDLGSCREKSRAAFVSKMTPVGEDAGDALYCLERLVDSATVRWTQCRCSWAKRSSEHASSSRRSRRQGDTDAGNTGSRVAVASAINPRAAFGDPECDDGL